MTEVLAVDGDDLLAHRARALGLVRQGFATVGASPGRFTAELYGDFFANNPRYRKFFGPAAEPGPAADARDARTLAVFGRIVAELDRPGALLPLLRRLALDYRKYGVREAHYRAFAGSVLTALERTIGPDWSYDYAEAFVDELTMVASAMLGIAAEADAQGPAYWEAEVVSVEPVAEDVVALRARPAFDYSYRAGQYAAVELGRLPWVWRDFSFATAPHTAAAGDADGAGTILEFHVQRSAGGLLTAVVHDELQPGDRIRVAAPAGELAFPAGASRLVAVGHGTGIAPIVALVEEAVAAGDDRPLHVVVGDSQSLADKRRAQADAAEGNTSGGDPDAPAVPDHYLAPRLAALAAEHGNLTVTLAGAADALPERLAAYLADISGGTPLRGWGGVAVGSTSTVRACLDVLAAAGADPADMRSDLFG